MLNWLKRRHMPLVKWDAIGDGTGLLSFKGPLTIEAATVIRAAWASGWRPSEGKWERIPC